MATDPNSLQNIQNSDTFNQWKEKINDTIDAVKTVNTLATDANVLDQNFSLAYIGTDLDPLEIGVYGGYLRQDSEIVALFPAASPEVYTFSLPPSSTVYVFINADYGFEVLDANTVVPATGAILLYTITTGVASITSVIEQRTFAIGRVAPPEGTGLPIEEVQEATTEGQTDFYLATADASAGLAVFIDGARASEGIDYVALTDTHIQFTLGLPYGTRVLFVSRDLSGQVKLIAREYKTILGFGDDTINVPVSMQPTNQSITVYVNGVRIPRDELTFDAALNTIQLSYTVISSPGDEILLVKGDLAGVSEFQGLPVGGTEGQTLAKWSSGLYDGTWTSVYNQNAVYNGGCTLANGASGTVSNTTFTEYEVDNLFIKCNKATGITAAQSAVVSKTISSTVRASHISINSGAIGSYPATIEHRAYVYSGQAARFNSEACVASCKVYQNSGANATATIKVYRVDAAENPDMFDGTIALVGTSTAFTIPSGTATDVYYKIGNAGTAYNGLIFQVDLTIASGAGTVTCYVSEFDLRLGYLKMPFEPNYQLDCAFGDYLSRIGAAENFFEESAPRGYLALDGSQYLISKYPLLNKRLNGRFNDGTETAGYFRLPDARGLVYRGTDVINASFANRDPDAQNKTVAGDVANGNDYITNVSLVDMQKLSKYMLVTTADPDVTIPANTQVDYIDFSAGIVYLTNSVSVSPSPQASVSFTVASRILPDGTTGAEIGSVQQDAFLHAEIPTSTTAGATHTLTNNGGNVNATVYSQNGGTETRMKNMYVLPCIKAK